MSPRACHVVVVLVTCWTAQFSMAATVAPPTAASRLADRAVAFLEKSQAPDGSWSKAAGPGVTAIAAAGIMAHGRSPDDPVVARALKHLESCIHSDGGVYAEGSRHQNYETCIAMLALKAANADGRYDDELARAEEFVKTIQWDDGEGYARDSLNFGGAGYGSHSRPDLSNTAFLVDTLHQLGDDADDAAIQRALVFVSRCQNLATEHNTTKFPALNSDGGFYYTIAAGGESEAGELENGGLRSYGSMTYQGLKSMIYAGVGRDDPRVKAAIEWVQKNYSLEQNPGMGSAGLYYYYHTFAKALAAVGEAELVDAEGKSHEWRKELVAELAKRQQPDGSWLNDNARWMEGDANLVTAYALLALAQCGE